MSTVTLREAQARLPDLIARLQPGDELVIAEDGKPLAKLTRAPRTSWPCEPGSAKDRPVWIAPDFDAPLEDFREYMD